MPRKYCAKGIRGRWPEEQLNLAIAEVKEKKTAVAVVARMYNIPRLTLRRYVLHINVRPGKKTLGNSISRRFLDDNTEQQLATYLIDMESKGFGLTRADVLELVDFHVKSKQGQRLGAERRKRHMTGCMVSGNDILKFRLKHLKVFPWLELKI